MRQPVAKLQQHTSKAQALLAEKHASTRPALKPSTRLDQLVESATVQEAGHVHTHTLELCLDPVVGLHSQGGLHSIELFLSIMAKHAHRSEYLHAVFTWMP